MATAATPEATTPDPYTLVPERPRYARAPTHREFVHVGAAARKAVFDERVERARAADLATWRR